MTTMSDNYSWAKRAVASKQTIYEEKQKSNSSISVRELARKQLREELERENIKQFKKLFKMRHAAVKALRNIDKEILDYEVEIMEGIAEGDSKTSVEAEPLRYCKHYNEEG